MGTVFACVAAMGAISAAIGTVYSIGWLILAGGIAFIAGALGTPSGASRQ
ncbi:hypothetical protein SAMN05421748_102340 [Paractinoplanes atraurantiacus]|uniref:Uncharacterized protein n=1 Tax=Paractinoplanes atraurantiacus TaxID=1036182 RepID=A0A285GQ69_9ACTN|nr:hypothetical protein SAMN05421748_102340 [Actinoplanes atraurantiacus]